MNEKDLERSEWLGVVGAGMVAAAITAVAMPWPAPSRAHVAEAARACSTDAMRTASATDAQASPCRSGSASPALEKEPT
ncbi:hypothetical protein [Piscinibacter sp.]|uniref:hypothetical protein n=1 Tax=Piscinibacter sp. TaxID=1903157 RepID=UPI002BC26499|nr:hypothetical protein [Albitalea sp.]HUG22383.1 hypothetical protein [Albitalea sp.]